MRQGTEIRKEDLSLTAEWDKTSGEIRSAALVVHGDKAHSYYFGRDAIFRKNLA